VSGRGPGRKGRGGVPLLRDLACTAASSEVDDVAGVVEAVVDPTADEFNVDEDFFWATPLPLGMGAWPLLIDWAFSPLVLMLDLLFLRRLLRKEGIAGECCGSDV
jgi:hypothetical protein